VSETTPAACPFDPYAAEFRADPHAAFAEMRAECPVHRFAGDDVHPSFLALSGAEVAFDVLRNPAPWTSTQGPGVRHLPEGRSVMALVDRDPPEHTFQRRLINKAFTPRVVAGMEPGIQRLADSLLDSLADRGGCELVDDYADRIPLFIMAEMLGVPVTEDVELQHRFRSWVDVFTMSVAAEEDPDEFRAAFREFRAYWQDHLATRRAVVEGPGDAPQDLLTRLIDAELDGVRLTDDEIMGFVLFLLVAGTGTTTLLIGNLVYRLLEHPDQLARVRADPDLWEAAVEESLRYDAPVHGLFRTPLDDVEVEGVPIEQDTKVMVLYGSANHDEGYWDAPERFDVGRDLADVKRHFAFGTGAHLCLGAPLARLEGRIAVRALFERFPDLRMGDGERRRHESMVLWGFRTLPVEWGPA
jgi:cytochrome P450